MLESTLFNVGIKISLFGKFNFCKIFFNYPNIKEFNSKLNINLLLRIKQGDQKRAQYKQQKDAGSANLKHHLTTAYLAAAAGYHLVRL